MCVEGGGGLSDSSADRRVYSTAEALACLIVEQTPGEAQCPCLVAKNPPPLGGWWAEANKKFIYLKSGFKCRPLLYITSPVML